MISENVRGLVKNTIRLKKRFIAGESYIPVAFAVYDHKEIEALVQCALDFHFVDGEISRTFERDMAKFVGTRHATFCNSGSSANLLAIMSLTSPRLGSRALQAGDEIITPAVGFPTTIAPIIQAGCIPIYVDTNLGTYNPSPFQVEDAITEKTKAIFIAHTLGNPFDVEAIKDIAERNGLWLVEDVADAIGGEFNGKKLGTFGNLATTSFYPAHIITCGEGGMVFTDSPMLNLIVKSFRDWGKSCFCMPNKDNTCGHRFSQNEKERGELPEGYDHKYIFSHVGYNLKSTDLQASIGIEQLKKLPYFMGKRRENWRKLLDGFLDSGLDKYFILPTKYEKSNPVPFGFVLTIRETSNFTRSEIVQYLESMKIGTRNLFAGNITKQPGFAGKGRIPEMGGLPKSDIIMNSTFWIGCHPAITDDMISYIITKFVDFIEERK